MKKILFFIPSLTGRGAEKVLVNLINNMDCKKFDITLLVLFDEGTNKENLNKQIKYKYIYKKVFRGNIHYFKLWTPQKLYKKFIKNEYDIIVSYLEGPTTRIASGCDNPNTRLINWIHKEMRNIKEFSSSYRNIKEFFNCMKKYNETIFVSQTAKATFEKETKLYIPSKVIYNLVDNKKIQDKACKEIDDIEFKRDIINLISVGSLVHQKGYLRLLKVFNRILQKYNNVHLYILGDGKERKKMEAYIYENNLEDKVTLLGYKKNPYKYVKASDLFVCSSYYEGYSTAVTEALIVGTPVITTLCSGMEELLENGKYGIITENSAEDLYKGICRIINNKELLNKYKKLAIERSYYFDLEKNLEENERLFNEK